MTCAFSFVSPVDVFTRECVFTDTCLEGARQKKLFSFTKLRKAWARMQNVVIAYTGSNPFRGVCYCDDRGASTFVFKSENCAGNSYPLGILLEKGVPFTFLRAAHALANFSPAHPVARRFVVYKLYAPWRQRTDPAEPSWEADTFLEILHFVLYCPIKKRSI